MKEKPHKLAKAEELLKEEAEVILQTFRTAPGKKLLKMLIALFYDKPSYRLGGDTHDMAFREGQRDIVGYLKEQMEKAEEVLNG